MERGKKKLGRTEWMQFQAEAEQLPAAYCANGRPSPATAEAVTELVGIDIAALFPKARYASDGDLAIIAQQALTVVLDVFIRAAQDHRTVSSLRVITALAERWSASYQQAQRDCPGIVSVRDMALVTNEAIRRDLLCHGINVAAIWRLVAGEWSDLKTGANPLFRLGPLIPKVGRQVKRRGPDAFQAFEAIVDADPHYRRPAPRTPGLLLTSEPTPPGHIRQQFAGGRPYNTVTTGPRSDSLLERLEGTQLLFDVDAFRMDYKRYHQVLSRKAKRSTRRRRLTKLEHRLAQIERVRDQVRALDLRGLVPIKSGFFRAINRRYHARHFWPEHVSGKADPALFGSPRERWFLGYRPSVTPGGPPVVALRGYDVSASQTQILALLLGITELEARASDPGKPFKTYLAQMAWKAHLDGRLPLRPGYESAQNIVPLVKGMWTKHLYGSELRQIVRGSHGWIADLPPYRQYQDPVEQRQQTDIYNQRVTVGTAHLEAFLHGLPWYAEVSAWFKACRQIARRCQQAAPCAGAEFVDPYDGAVFRINPLKRTEHRLRSDLDLRLSLPTFGPDGGYLVDGRALGQKLAPVLIHTVDAYYAALVMEALSPLFKEGVEGYVLHDAFYLEDKDWGQGNSLETLQWILAGVTVWWFKGLGPVYDRLIGYLGDDHAALDGTQTYSQFVHRIRDRWLARVDRMPRRRLSELEPYPLDWPRFALSPTPAPDYPA